MVRLQRCISRFGLAQSPLFNVSSYFNLIIPVDQMSEIEDASSAFLKPSGRLHKTQRLHIRHLTKQRRQ